MRADSAIRLWQTRRRRTFRTLKGGMASMAEAKRKLAAIMAADVAGYSRLMGDDERATMDMLVVCRDVFRKHISDHEGRVVDTAGDSILAVFPSVVEAVDCAVI